MNLNVGCRIFALAQIVLSLPLDFFFTPNIDTTICQYEVSLRYSGNKIGNVNELRIQINTVNSIIEVYCMLFFTWTTICHTEHEQPYSFIYEWVLHLSSRWFLAAIHGQCHQIRFYLFEQKRLSMCVCERLNHMWLISIKWRRCRLGQASLYGSVFRCLF